VTTGIYCRPICPAKTPHRENVRFFGCAAAAEEAGFRPCKRCRPETAPGTPVWNGTESSVARGIRLINSGFLEERSVEELSATLGMGARHLRRLFLRHLGAPPKALDVQRRTHFAALLLSQTSLAIASVALDSGFRSIRQFNEAFRNSFGVSPTDVRRQRLDGTEFGRNDVTTELKLSYRPPFDWKGLIGFFSARAVRGIESVTEREYRRSFSVVTKKGVSAGVLSVTNSPERNCLIVKLAAPPVKLSSVVARIRAMFDLSADPQIIGEHLDAEGLLHGVSREIPGIRIPGVWDPFEAAIRAVVGQQITVRAAVGLLERIVRMCGTRFETGFDESIGILFPTPQALYDADLDGLGMPGARKKTLKAIAAAWIDGSVPVKDYGSPEELTSALLSIPGVGPWTAEYIALRGFGEPDAFPSSDIALRAAVGRLLGRNEYASASEVAEIADAWRPWRGYAAQLLWRSLSRNREEG